MSKLRDRRKAKASRREDYVEMVLKLERERRAEEVASGGRGHPRDDLERLKWAARAANIEAREWMLEYLGRTSPEPGQKGDGLLGDKVGLRKRSKMGGGSNPLTLPGNRSLPSTRHGISKRTMCRPTR